LSIYYFYRYAALLGLYLVTKSQRGCAPIGYHCEVKKHLLCIGGLLLLSVGISSCEPAATVTEQVLLKAPPFKAEAKMNKQEFWRIIDFSKHNAAGNDDAQYALLVK
jgi:hypothetical protein